MKNVLKQEALAAMALLGYQVEDVVTGNKGVATSICFDLYGCIQVIVTPKVKEDNSVQDQHWRDAKRLRKISDQPVMEVPDFVVEAGKTGDRVPGPDMSKPLPRNGPR